MSATARTTKRSFALTKPQLSFLIREAKRLDLTVSELLRRILDKHLEDNARKQSHA